MQICNRVPKHFYKPRFNEQLQFVQLRPALGDQVTDLVQQGGNATLLFYRR